MPKFLETVKAAAMDAAETGKPVNVLFGTVISASPLKIQVDQKLILSAKMLILARNVTDFTVYETMNHQTEDTGGGSGDAAFESHHHVYAGKKAFQIHNGLVMGEKVILIRVQGGQKYLVIDRLGA